MTQSYFQHRLRHAATASSAERFGRYPKESGWNIGSTLASNRAATTVWAILSATVGTPSILTLPSGFGIGTARDRRGGGGS